MLTNFKIYIFIILFSISLQDEMTNTFLESLTQIKPDLNMEINISREYIKAKRQQELNYQNNSILKSMENITIETFWRYPKPVLRKEEQESEQENHIQVNKPKKKQPRFMQPLEKNKNKVIQIKRDNQKHEITNEQLIVPGNLISVEEAQLEKPIQDRQENYKDFLKKAKFLFDFLYVDLNKYRQYNYLQLGDQKKYHDFNLIDRKNKFHERYFPNIHFWFYSQEEDFNFYNLRAMINNEYRFFDEFSQEQIQYENKGSFFGPRIANCWNDIDIFTSQQKAKQKFVVNNQIQLTYNNEQFQAKIKEITNSKTHYLTINISQNENAQIKQAKKDYIDYITTMQLSKQQLNQIGSLGKLNKDDKCYYNLSFKSDSSNLLLEFTFKISEYDWSKMNAVYTGYKNLITENCQVVRNEIYENDYLGQRMKKKDLEVKFKRSDRNYYLKAYLKNNTINYLVVYDLTRQYFMMENVYESALKTFQDNDINIDGCVYHNDNYLINKDFNEMYMITFYQNIDENSARKFEILNSQHKQIEEQIQKDSERDFDNLYEQNPKDQNKLNLLKIHTMIKQHTENDMEILKEEMIGEIKEDLKQEITQEIKSQVIKELKEYIDNRKLI